MSEYDQESHKRTTGVSPLSEIPDEAYDIILSDSKRDKQEKVEEDGCGSKGLVGVILKRQIRWYFKKRLWPLTKLCLWLIFLGLVFNVLWTDYISKSEGFATKEVEISSNGMIQEGKIWELMGIEDPEVSLLSLDLSAAEKKLRDCPAINNVIIRRDFPDKLCVEVDARVPVLWLECPDLGLRAHDLENGLLVDSSGIIFPYIDGMTVNQENLPVLVVNSIDNIPVDLKQPITSQMGAVKIVNLYKRKAPADSPAIVSICKMKDWAYEVFFNDGSQATFESNELVIESQVDKFLLVAPRARARAQETNSGVGRINLIPEVNVPVKFKDEKAIIPIAEPAEE